MRRHKWYVIEAKNINELTTRTIDNTVKKYQHPFHPDKFRIAIPKRTKVSKETREYARKRNVKIDRLRGY